MNGCEMKPLAGSRACARLMRLQAEARLKLG